jgi:adenylate cyclase
LVGSKKEKKSLGFEFSAFSTAYKMFKIENGNVKELKSSGIIGKNKNESIPSFQKKIEPFESKSDEYFILIQCSNFHYRSGGFFEPIILGHYKSLKLNFEKLIIKDFFSMGILFIMALYHFGLFLLRREDLGSFWFGSFCLTQFIRLGVTPLSYLLQYTPSSEYLFLINAKLEFLTIVAPTPMFLMFLKSLFKDHILNHFHIWPLFCVSLFLFLLLKFSLLRLLLFFVM